MTNKHLAIVLATLLALIVGGGALYALAQVFPGTPVQTVQEQQATPAPEPELPYPEGGGTLILRVNPEFAIHYDAQGMVVGVEERNDDARAMGLDLTGYEGQECRAAISGLVAKIREAGYLIEEVEGEGNVIDLEVEEGSSLPANDFLRNIVLDTQTYMKGQQASASMQVVGASNYGWTDYADSDYGPDNDGVTDYNDSDYGPLNDGVTDYEQPAATGSSGSTNYTDYGTSSNSNSGYSNHAGSGGSGSTGSSSGGSSSGSAASTPAPAPAPEPTPAPAPTPSNSGYDSGHDSGNSGYNSGYDSGNSGHDDSGYDD